MAGVNWGALLDADPRTRSPRFSRTVNGRSRGLRQQPAPQPPQQAVDWGALLDDEAGNASPPPSPAASPAVPQAQPQARQEVPRRRVRFDGKLYEFQGAEWTDEKIGAYLRKNVVEPQRLRDAAATAQAQATPPQATPPAAAEVSPPQASPQQATPPQATAAPPPPPRKRMSSMELLGSAYGGQQAAMKPAPSKQEMDAVKEQVASAMSEDIIAPGDLKATIKQVFQDKAIPLPDGGYREPTELDRLRAGRAMTKLPEMQLGAGSIVSDVMRASVATRDAWMMAFGLQAIGAANRIKAGDKSPGNYGTVAAFLDEGRKLAEQYDRMPWYEQASEGVLKTLEFASALVGSAPVSQSVRTGVSKSVPGIAGKVAGEFAGESARMLAAPGLSAMAASGTVERMAPQGIDQQGLQEGDPFVEAFTKAAGSQVITQLTERSGEALLKLPGLKQLKAAVVKRFGIKPGSIRTAAEWSGPLAEFLEERVDDVSQALWSGAWGDQMDFGPVADAVSGDPDRMKQGLRSLAIESVVLGTVGGPGMVSDMARGQARKGALKGLRAERADQQQSIDEFMQPQSVAAWANANPDVAAAVAATDQPSRKQWKEDYGLPDRVPQAQRKQFADMVRGVLADPGRVRSDQAGGEAVGGVPGEAGVPVTDQQGDTTTVPPGGQTGTATVAPPAEAAVPTQPTQPTPQQPAGPAGGGGVAPQSRPSRKPTFQAAKPGELDRAIARAQAFSQLSPGRLASEIEMARSGESSAVDWMVTRFGDEAWAGKPEPPSVAPPVQPTAPVTPTTPPAATPSQPSTDIAEDQAFLDSLDEEFQQWAGEQQAGAAPNVDQEQTVLDEIEKKVKAEEAKQEKSRGESVIRFSPTDEWQDIPDGAVLPPGLEIRMNIETGKNQARKVQEGQKDASAVRSPEAEVRQVEGGADLRGAGQVEVPAQPAGQGSAARTEGEGKGQAEVPVAPTTTKPSPAPKTRLPQESLADRKRREEFEALGERLREVKAKESRNGWDLVPTGESLRNGSKQYAMRDPATGAISATGHLSNLRKTADKMNPSERKVAKAGKKAEKLADQFVKGEAEVAPAELTDEQRAMFGLDEPATVAAGRDATESSPIEPAELRRRLRSVENKSNRMGYEPLSDSELEELVAAGYVEGKGKRKGSLTEEGRRQLQDLDRTEGKREFEDAVNWDNEQEAVIKRIEAGEQVSQQELDKYALTGTEWETRANVSTPSAAPPTKTPALSDAELKQRILDAMLGKAEGAPAAAKPVEQPSTQSPPSKAKQVAQEGRQQAQTDYDAAKERFRKAFNKAKGTSLSTAPLTPEYVELLSATADMMVQGIRVKAWSFAEIVADLAETFGRENIPAMREYLQRGWDAAVKIEGVDAADYDAVFGEYQENGKGNVVESTTGVDAKAEERLNEEERKLWKARDAEEKRMEKRRRSGMVPPPITGELQGKSETRIEEIDKRLAEIRKERQGLYEAAREKPTEPKPPEAKQPWEMTQSEYTALVADETVKGVASRTNTGRVIDGLAIHADAMQRLNRGETIADEGFTTSKGRYVSRAEAAMLTGGNYWQGVLDGTQDGSAEGVLAESEDGRQPKQAEAYHRAAVEQAIAAGKIESHPDYPDLKPKPKEQPPAAETKPKEKSKGLKPAVVSKRGQTALPGMEQEAAEAETRLIPKEPGTQEEIQAEIDFRLQEIDDWRSGAKATPGLPANGSRYALDMEQEIARHDERIAELRDRLDAIDEAEEQAAVVPEPDEPAQEQIPESAFERVERLASTWSQQAAKDEGGRGLAVGAENINYRWAADAIRSLVQRVRAGTPLEQAAEETKAEAREWIAKHNARRPKDINWQRWEGAADNYIDTAVRMLSEKETTPTTEQSAAAETEAVNKPTIEVYSGDDIRYVNNGGQEFTGTVTQFAPTGKGLLVMPDGANNSIEISPDKVVGVDRRGKISTGKGLYADVEIGSKSGASRFADEIVARTLRQEQRKGKPAWYDGSYFYLTTGKYEVVLDSKGHPSIKKMHNLSEDGQMRHFSVSEYVAYNRAAAEKKAAIDATDIEKQRIAAEKNAAEEEAYRQKKAEFEDLDAKVKAALEGRTVKGSKQDIKIKLADGKKTETVKATVYGNLAVHKVEKVGYMVASVPAQMNITSFETAAQAKEFVRVASTLSDFTGKSSKDFPSEFVRMLRRAADYAKGQMRSVDSTEDLQALLDAITSPTAKPAPSKGTKRKAAKAGTEGKVTFGSRRMVNNQSALEVRSNDEFAGWITRLRAGGFEWNGKPYKTEAAAKKAAVDELSMEAPSSSKAKIEEARKELGDAVDRIFKSAKGDQPGALGLNRDTILAIGDLMKATFKLGRYEFQAFVEAVVQKFGRQFAIDNANFLREKWDAIAAKAQGRLGASSDVVEMMAEAEQPEAAPVEDAADEPVAPPPAEPVAPAPPSAPIATPGDAGDTTGTKNIKTDKLRAKAGLGERVMEDPESVEEWQNVRPMSPELTAELAETPRNLSPREEAALNKRIRILENRRQAGEDVQDELLTAIEASERVGRLWGQSGVSRQAELQSDFTVTGIVRQHIRSVGEKPTAEQMAEIEKQAAKIKELEDQLKVSQEKAAEEAAKQAVADAVEETKKPAKTPPSKGKVEAAKERAKKAAANVKEKFKALFGVGITPDPTMANEREFLKAVVEAIRAYADLFRVQTFTGFRSWMKSEAGIDVDKADNILRMAWDQEVSAGTIEVPEVDSSNNEDVSRLARKILREVVESGITETDAAIDAVHAEMQKYIPDVTRESARDAASGYGLYRELPKDEVSQIVQRIKGESQQTAKIETLQRAIARAKELLAQGKTQDEVAAILAREGLYPKSTGIERRDVKDVEAQLIKEVNRLKKEMPVTAKDKAGRLKSALGAAKTAAQNRIRDLGVEIAALEKSIANKTPLAKPIGPTRLTPDAELVAAREQVAKRRQERDDLKAEYEKLFPTPKTPTTEAQRIAAAIRALDRVIAQMEADLAAGKLEGKAKGVKLDSPELAARRARLQELRDQREELRENDPAYKAQEEAQRTARYKRSLDKRLEYWEKRLADAQKGKLPAKPRQTPVDKEILDQKAKIVEKKTEALRKVFEIKREMRPKIQKMAELVPETLNTSRAILTAFDLSAVLRQGGVLSAAHPMISKRAFVPMLEAFGSEHGQAKATAMIADLPSAKLAREAGLDITTNEDSLNKMEEQYMSRLAEKIPGVAHSGRAYMTFMNVQRALVFDELVRKLGKGGQVTLEEAKVLANWVNVASGRGNMARAQAAASALSTVFFAPRYVLSRFQILLGQPLWTGVWKGDGGWRARKLVAMEYGRAASGLLTFYGTFALMAALLYDDDDEEKPTISFDWRSSDFGKLKFGETRIDPLAGLSQATVLLGREITGKTVTASGEVKPIRGEDRQYSDPTMLEIFGRFMRSKLSPFVGTAVNVGTGENVVGEKVTVAQGLKDLVVPLIVEDIYDAMRAQGITDGTTMAILSILGMSSQTYGPLSDYRKAGAEDQQKMLKEWLETARGKGKPEKQKTETSTQYQERVAAWRAKQAYAAAALESVSKMKK